VTPTVTPTMTPTMTPTASPTPPQSTLTSTPRVTQACIFPKIDVEVECEVCGG
jgi:hypothetical protein